MATLSTTTTNAGLRRTTRRAGLVGFLLAAMVACSGSDSDDGASPISAPGSTPTTAAGGGSGVTTSALAPVTTEPSRPPATRGPRTVVVGPVTFHVPANWTSFESGGSTYVGESAGKQGHMNLIVTTDYGGTVDALRHDRCQGDGTHESKPPANVELIESGFEPVGRATAEFRRWRFACPDSEITVEEHRAWLLPVSRVGIVEQRHVPQVLDVVTTAEVA